MRHWVLALALSACGSSTGWLVDVGGPSVGSQQAGIHSLEFRIAHRSFCERFIEEPTARVTVDVSRRELTRRRYQLLLRPPHVFDLAHDQLFVLVLARDANNQLIASAASGPHGFALNQIAEVQTDLALLPAPSARSAYLADDGDCACLPGASWIGNGSGVGCDARIVTSFDALVRVAGCELSPGAPQSAGPVCDGQLYSEVVNRPLPCFAHRLDGACAVGLRHCHDDDGRAYDDECAPVAAAPTLADDKLCADYSQALGQACGDVIGRLRSTLGHPTLVRCTLFADPQVLPTAAQMPCGGTVQAGWSAALPPLGDNCVATILDGVAQPPFTLGIAAPMMAGAQPFGPCPTQLLVDSLHPTNEAELGVPHLFHLTVGDAPVDVRIDVVRSCTAGQGMVCHL